MKPYRPAITSALKHWNSSCILDIPSGGGWLRASLPESVVIDGLDLFAERPDGYRNFAKWNMDFGIPEASGVYDSIVSCEAIAYLTNPGHFFAAAHKHLTVGGHLLLSTPNTAFASARLQKLFRGVTSVNPPMIQPGINKEHLPLFPWDYPLLHHFLMLAGFSEITLHEVDEPKPKRVIERLWGWAQTVYCAHKMSVAASAEEKSYWKNLGSSQANYGHRLVVSAKKVT